MPAGPLERIHLSMKHRTSLLDASIMAATANPAAMDQHGADWNAAFVSTAQRFVNRCRKKGVHTADFALSAQLGPRTFAG